jgi:hypothetical protein
VLLLAAQRGAAEKSAKALKLTKGTGAKVQLGWVSTAEQGAFLDFFKTGKSLPRALVLRAPNHQWASYTGAEEGLAVWVEPYVTGAKGVFVSARRTGLPFPTPENRFWGGGLGGETAFGGMIDFMKGLAGVEGEDGVLMVLIGLFGLLAMVIVSSRLVLHV